MLDMRAIGKRIREERKRRGLTQGEFAAAVNVSFQAVSNWERGIAPPDLENLIRIADFFAVPIDELLRGGDEEIFLGIDGGGTKTELVAVSAAGFVKKRIVKDGCNPNDVGYQRMLLLLCEGISEMLTEFKTVKSIYCGIAGITVGNHKKCLYADIKQKYPWVAVGVNSDSLNLFSDDGADIAVISGTGSVVFVRRGEEYHRLGGWGYLFDEAGSAYDIGRDAIRTALAEDDAGEEPSKINRLLCQRLGTEKLWGCLNAVYKGGRAYIASLASVVFDAYREGDSNAEAIIDRNARALAELLNRGVELYGVKPIAMASGGIFEHHGDVMLEKIAKYSDVKITVNELPPVYGACKKAIRLADIVTDGQFYDNFKNSYRGIER